MFDAVTNNIGFLMGGFLVTLELTGFALIGGIILGAQVGLGRISKRKWIYYPVTWYVNFLRNMPLILVIFWFYFVMPIIAGRPLNPFLSAVISFIIFEATYFGEIFCAGYQSISKDLSAEAYSTGMTMLCVTHEIGLAREVADEIIFMDFGKIVERGTYEGFFNNPKSERAKEFLDQIL
jgi:glutamate/aspartate transport system permease protein